MFFLLFLQNVFSFFRSNMQSSIDMLHARTPFRTFYDLFDEAENTDLKSIKSKFKLMIRQKDLIRKNMEKYDKEKFKITDKELENLITDGYNILTRQKAEYDRLLGNKFTLPFDPKSPLFFYINLAATLIFVGFLTDLIISFLLYLREKEKFEKMSKKERKQLGITSFDKFSINNLFLVRKFTCKSDKNKK